MNSEGLNNLLKVIELVRGKLGFESRCAGPVAPLSDFHRGSGRERIVV